MVSGQWQEWEWEEKRWAGLGWLIVWVKEILPTYLSYLTYVRRYFYVARMYCLFPGYWWILRQLRRILTSHVSVIP